MHWTAVDSRAARGAGVTAAASLMLALWLGSLPLQNLTFLLVALLLVLFVVPICSVLLVVHHHRFFGQWYGFLLLNGAFAAVRFAGGISSQNRAEPGLLLVHLAVQLATLALPALLPGSVTALIILVIRMDVGLLLAGASLVVFVWGMLLLSVPYRGPIRAWLAHAAAADPSQFWWFEQLVCLNTCAVPVGLTAFAVRPAYLIRKQIERG